jgi:sugar-specific transcriptional regulator TrmB
VEDYKNKIITNLFKKFDEAMLKVENKKDMLSNDIEEVGNYFDEEINKVESKTINSITNFFQDLRSKLKMMVHKKYSNFMKALNDLHLEIELTRYPFNFFK